jgi:hypothetical protein
VTHIDESAETESDSLKPLCMNCDQDELFKLLCKKGGRITVESGDGQPEDIVISLVDVPRSAHPRERKRLHTIVKNLAAIQVAAEWGWKA